MSKEAKKGGNGEGQKEGKQKREDVKEEPKEPEPEIEMNPGDYRVQIHIMECKDLKPKPAEGALSFMDGGCDPMIKVEIMN